MEVEDFYGIPLGLNRETEVFSGFAYFFVSYML